MFYFGLHSVSNNSPNWCHQLISTKDDVSRAAKMKNENKVLQKQNGGHLVFNDMLSLGTCQHSHTLYETFKPSYISQVLIQAVH